MAARIHRIGNIYTRIEGLLNKGFMKEADKPIWFEVYNRFPPKYDPTFKRKAPEVKVIDIFYREDILRAKIQKRLPRPLDMVDLKSNRILFSQKLMQHCQESISQGMSEDEAIDKAFAFYNVKESTSEPEKPVNIELDNEELNSEEGDDEDIEDEIKKD